MKENDSNIAHGAEKNLGKYIYDVVVLGGGPAGVSAAIASKKSQAKTLLIEKEGWLGGMPTGAYTIALCGFYNGKYGKDKIIRGNFERITNKAIKMGFAEGTKWGKRIKNPEDAREITIDPEGFKYVLDTIIVENSIDTYLRSFAFEAREDGDLGIIECVWIIGKYGRKRIEGKIFVDCTGDADTAIWLDQTYMKGFGAVSMGVRLGGLDTDKIKFKDDEPKPKVKFTNGEFSIDGWLSLKNQQGELFFDCMKIENANLLTVEAITYAEQAGRYIAQEALKEIRKHSGFEKAYVISTGPVMGNRKPRHVITQYFLTDDDENLDPADSIAIAGNVMKDHGAMKIPYRTLLSKRVKNLLYAGRCITPLIFGPLQQQNSNFIAYEIPRLVPVCMATGEAAGIAAAMAANKNIPIYNVDVKELQNKLKARGAIF